MIQRIRKIVRTAFTPLPTFTVDDSLSPDFSFRKLWREHRRITSARLELMLWIFTVFAVSIFFMVVI